MKNTFNTIIIAMFAIAGSELHFAPAKTKKWKAGKGWGWELGPIDEIGALNEMTDASHAAAGFTQRLHAHY